MSDKTEKKGPAKGGDETRSLGRPADPAVKAERPQVADKDKLGLAATSVENLADRLAQLDKASGPFGSDDVDFAAGKVDGLLADDAVASDAPEEAAPVPQDLVEPEPVADPVATGQDDTETPDVATESPVDETPAPDTIGETDDLADTSGAASEDTSWTGSGDDDPLTSLDAILENEVDLSPRDEPEESATPISSLEHEASEDAEYNASMDAFLDEMSQDGAFGDGDDLGDPIDDMVDDSHSEDRPSPFAALFSPVGDAGAFADDDIPERDAGDEGSLDDEAGDVDYDDDDALFFGPEDDIDLPRERDEAAPATLPGAHSFAEPDLDAATGEVAGEDAGDAAGVDTGSDLPQLTMGVDDGMYAPGTDYADESEAHTSEEEDFADLLEVDDSAAQRDNRIEKEDDMAISVNGSGDEEKPVEDQTWDTRDEDNTFDADDIDAFSDDETGQDDDLDDADLDAILADDDDAGPDEEPVADDGPDAADTLFGADEEDDHNDISDIGSRLGGMDTVDETDTIPAATPDVIAADEPAQDDVTASGNGDDDAPAKPAKKKRGLLLAAVSVLVIGGLGAGYAAMNGLIPGVSVPGLPPVAVANNDTPDVVAPADDRDPIVSDAGMDPMPAVEDVDTADIGLDDDAGAPDDVAGDEIADAGAPDMSETPDMPAETPTEADADEDTVVVTEAGAEAADPQEEPGPFRLSDLLDPEERAAATEEEEADTVIDLTALADPTMEMGDDADPISALAAEIERGPNKANADGDAEVASGNSGANSVFVEEERVADLEETVTEMGLGLDTLTDEIAQMNKLMVQTMERTSTIASRVESNERSLRGVSAILAEFAKVKESLDQTQIVLLDVSARVGSLEAANPANADEVNGAISELRGEIKRLTANMSILARMTVNGTSVLKPGGMSSAEDGVQTSQSALPSGGSDTVFEQEGETAAPAPAMDIPGDVEPGDFVEGHGYVLDVVPASGNQNLVIMENASILVPK